MSSNQCLFFKSLKIKSSDEKKTKNDAATEQNEEKELKDNIKEKSRKEKDKDNDTRDRDKEKERKKKKNKDSKKKKKKHRFLK